MMVHTTETPLKGCVKRVGIKSNFSSAYISSATSRAEKQVQDIKKLIQKVKEGKEDWALVYSEWRNAPTAEGHSPAQLFYRRQVRSCVLPELIKMMDMQKMT